MDFLKDLKKENLHHAHLVISDPENVIDDVFNIVENNLGTRTKANEFFFFEKYDKFLIDDARKVFDLHLKKTPKDELQIFVIAFNFITNQAQNSLLKMLEEPKERTHFFIIAPSKSLFLETIVSRVSIIEIAGGITSDAKKFLNKNVGERIKYVADLTKDIKEEKKTKQDAINLLSGLEIELEKKKDFDALKSVIETRKYINLNGASVKILLENVALQI